LIFLIIPAPPRGSGHAAGTRRGCGGSQPDRGRSIPWL